MREKATNEVKVKVKRYMYEFFSVEYQKFKK